MDRPFSCIAIGVAIWIIALPIMRYMVPFVFDLGLMHWAFWGANFLIPALFIPPIAKLLGRTKSDMLAPVALITLPIMVMDSVAVTLDGLGKTAIYTDHAEIAAATGGFLLFAMASCFFWALVWSQKSP